MKRSQLIITAIGIALVVTLFRLPKVVVDNEANPVGEQPPPKTSPALDQAHDPTVPDDQAAFIKALEQSMADSESKEKSAIFADSLAQAFLELRILDSAVHYAELAVQFNPNEAFWIKAGDVYYEALSFAVDKGRAARFGERTRFYYQKVLESSPGELDLKSKIAMTYVTTSNPMKGIRMLREVVEEDPENQEAISNLGVLSLQSGQYDRAIERFEKVIQLDPGDIQAQVFLGISYKEAGQKAMALRQFEKVKELTSDSSILATVESYLDDIN